MSKLLAVPAGSSDAYAKLGMMAIARYRFRAFEVKFHREPGLHEPLFFDEFEECPVKADVDTTRCQLAEAARATGIRLAPILKFLGLAPMAPSRSRANVKVPKPTKSRRLRTQSSGARRAGSGVSSTWSRFLADRRLRRRYAISGEELKVLAQVSFLGQAQTVDDCVLILNMIRQAGD